MSNIVEPMWNYWELKRNKIKKVMKISAEDSKTLKESLPGDYVERIRKALLDKGITISGRWILKVVSGEGDDNYGIIEEATQLALKEKKRLEKVKNQITKLTE